MRESRQGGSGVTLHVPSAHGPQDAAVPRRCTLAVALTAATILLLKLHVVLYIPVCSLCFKGAASLYYTIIMRTVCGMCGGKSAIAREYVPVCTHTVNLAGRGSKLTYRVLVNWRQERWPKSLGACLERRER